MHFAIGSVENASKKEQSISYTANLGPAYAVDEINAYIAIRNELLAEAEELRTRTKLDTVIVANNFVAGCLKPARKPYQAQCLPEADALRERQRCIAVSNRVAQLRAVAA